MKATLFLTIFLVALTGHAMDAMKVSSQAYFYSHILESYNCSSLTKAPPKKMKYELKKMLQIFNRNRDYDSYGEYKQIVCKKHPNFPICKMTLLLNIDDENKNIEKMMNGLYTPFLKNKLINKAVEELEYRGIRKDYDDDFETLIYDLKRGRVKIEAIYDALEILLAVRTKNILQSKALGLAQSLYGRYESYHEGMDGEDQQNSLKTYYESAIKEGDLDNIFQECKAVSSDLHDGLIMLAAPRITRLSIFLKTTPDKIIKDFCKSKNRKMLCNELPFLKELKRAIKMTSKSKE